MLRPETADKALRLTASFEGHGSGNAAGDFDGAVLTWGDLGFALGPGSLHTLLLRIVSEKPALLPEPFVEAIKGGQKATIAFVRQHILNPANPKQVLGEWQQRFVWLHGQPEVRAAIQYASQRYLQRAVQIAEGYKFETERGFCLAFDIAVQNGSVVPKARQWFLQHPEHKSPEEWRRLKALAHAVSQGALPQWRADVLSRKLAIAVGQGTVHGRWYNVKKEYGISYEEKWSG